ncbi:hypothetical protein IPC1162_07770 [Pseudomonas aeruginosa]|nr:hypothetical protein HV96_30345 [Pseudomonas aeruginosa]OHP40441.1 hypothetical protein HMPREF2535_00030 [Pseudomonas sp. HMSC060F12]AOT37598.1 hypothetical protein BHE76_10140 [Pseudomonas aeruginosa]AXC21255.1 hypothetical protein CWE28_14935 [Pseudomonas aeruginosa]KSF17070.1 hypothetical protein AO929_18010 [Pseudomonas aeruginosa]
MYKVAARVMGLLEGDWDYVLDFFEVVARDPLAQIAQDLILCIHKVRLRPFFPKRILDRFSFLLKSRLGCGLLGVLYELGSALAWYPCFG